MILLLISFFLSILNIIYSRRLALLEKCVINQGIAFGISIEYIVLISIFLLVSLVIVGYFSNGIIRYLLYAIFLFGMSNLMLRLILGGVCDYFSIYLLSFNIADLGILILCFWGVIKIIGINRNKSN